MIVINGSDRTLKIVYYGIEYELIPNEPVDLPEDCVRLFFGYGLQPSDSVRHWCCERLKTCNPELSQMNDAYIWQEIVKKIEMGEDALNRIKKKVK